MEASQLLEAGNVSLWRRSLHYLRPYRIQATLVLLAILVDVAFNLTFNYTVKILIDRAVAHRDQGLIAPILAGLAMFMIVVALGNIGRDYISAGVEARLSNNLRLRLLSHLHLLSADFYKRAQLGELLARFTNDVTAVKAALTRAFPSVVHRLIQAIASLVFLFLLDWRLGLLTVFVLGLSLIGPRFFVSRFIQAGYEASQGDASAVAAAQEYLGAHTVIQAFGLESITSSAFHRRLQEITPTNVLASRLGRLVRTSGVMGITFTTFVVTAAGIVLVSRNDLSVGGLVGFVGVLNLLAQASFRLTEVLPDWLTSAAGIQRLEDVFSEQPTVDQVAHATRLEGLGDGIRFAHVTFGYTSDESNIEDANFVIPAGSSIAIVGSSGSGKSTVLSLMMRIHDPDSGAIQINGHDLRSLTLDSLRAQFGVVFQESFLFDRSIRENIRLGQPGATDEEIMAAARAAQMHEFVDTLPQGYETTVGERGERLSGGQRQRIALARALVREPAVLVLDEATSALDPATEAAFNEILASVSHDRTVVSVTHRLSSVMGSDLIIVLEGGHVVEQGTHVELLERDGSYRRLWDQQAGFTLSDDGTRARITLDRLRQVPLFAQLDDAVVADLATRFVTERYRPGQDIIREGDIGDTFYIIVRGQVEVLRYGPDGTERRIAIREDGEILGEIALLANVPRTATARALTNCVLLALPRELFDALLHDAPELRAVIQRIAESRLNHVAVS